MKALLITKCGCSRLAEAIEGASAIVVPTTLGKSRTFNRANTKPMNVDGVDIEVFREE